MTLQFQVRVLSIDDEKVFSELVRPLLKKCFNSCQLLQEGQLPLAG